MLCHSSVACSHVVRPCACRTTYRAPDGRGDGVSDQARSVARSCRKIASVAGSVTGSLAHVVRRRDWLLSAHVHRGPASVTRQPKVGLASTFDHGAGVWPSPPTASTYSSAIGSEAAERRWPAPGVAGNSRAVGAGRRGGRVPGGRRRALGGAGQCRRRSRHLELVRQRSARRHQHRPRHRAQRDRVVGRQRVGPPAGTRRRACRASSPTDWPR